MKTLGLELSSARGSIALLEDGRSLFATEFPNDRKHSGLFFESLQRCVDDFGTPQRIVVGLGPGSYAGTRIAIAAAIGLGIACRASLIGLPSFCTLPANTQRYAVVGDARRQAFFFAVVDERRCLEGPMLYSFADLDARLATVGCPVFSAEALPQFPNVTIMSPSALVLAQLASHEPVSLVALEPIYLRDPHITVPRAL